MKTNINRYLLAVLLCGFSAAAWSDEYVLIDEHFNTLTINHSNLVYNEWVLTDGCAFGCQVDLENLALKIENQSSTVKGYTNSPSLKYSGDVCLSFKYAKGQNDAPKETGIKLTILNGGKFKENNKNEKTINVSTGHQRVAFFEANDIEIIDATPTTRIQFSQATIDRTFVIDDIKVTTVIERITLNESADNSSILSANNNLLKNVQIKRTLTGAIWNTLCLPFDVTKATMEQALGENQDIQMCTYSSYANEVMTFADATETTITAGTPFLIKLNSTVTDPTFQTVIVKNTPAQTIDHGGVKFVGTYSPVTLSTNGTNLFITKTNQIAKPTSAGTTMYGLRAYIDLSGGSSSRPARITFGDDDATTITTTKHSQMPTTLYDLSGRRKSANSRRGLSIADGRLILTK